MSYEGKYKINIYKWKKILKNYVKNRRVWPLKYWVTSGAERHWVVYLRLAGLLWLAVRWVFAAFDHYWLKLGIISSTWLHWQSARETCSVSVSLMCAHAHLHTHTHTHTAWVFIHTLKDSNNCSSIGEVPVFLWPLHHRHDQTEIMAASLYIIEATAVMTNWCIIPDIGNRLIPVRYVYITAFPQHSYMP